MWGVILEVFFALTSMVVVILTYDLSMIFKSRSKVVEADFETTMLVFRQMSLLANRSMEVIPIDH